MKRTFYNLDGQLQPNVVLNDNMFKSSVFSNDYYYKNKNDAVEPRENEEEKIDNSMSKKEEVDLKFVSYDVNPE